MKFTSNTIKSAWETRKAAATRFCCPVMEISWKCCLELAMEERMDRIELAGKIAEELGGRVWAPKGSEGIIRVYLAKGFCQVEEDGINIDQVGGNMFDDVKELASSLKVKSYRK